MFKPVPSSQSFPDLDREVMSLWDAERIFEQTQSGQTQSERGGQEQGEPFVFYEGPPTANGMPHPGHVLTRVMKDVFLRYQTMRGKVVLRRAGWGGGWLVLGLRGAPRYAWRPLCALRAR